MKSDQEGWDTALRASEPLTQCAWGPEFNLQNYKGKKEDVIKRDLQQGNPIFF